MKIRELVHRRRAGPVAGGAVVRQFNPGHGVRQHVRVHVREGVYESARLSRFEYSSRQRIKETGF
jgi:hypothetical protein